jgi:hypothetical protein
MKLATFGSGATWTFRNVRIPAALRCKADLEQRDTQQAGFMNLRPNTILACTKFPRVNTYNLADL